MFFGKSRKTYWQQVVEKELEKLESGDERALLTVYCAFAETDKTLMRRAGHAIRQLLDGRSLGQMIRLCERFRTFTSLEWGIDWAALSPKAIVQALDQEDRACVLILGTAHPNGYFRERCMEELAQEGGTLPYLMLRVNDWVVPVREKALLLVKRRIGQCSMEELLSSMPVYEKLQSSGRRSDRQLNILWKLVCGRLEQTLKGENRRDIWSEDFPVRKAIYRLTIEQKIPSVGQLDEWLRREKEPCGMVILIRGILAHEDCSLARASEYLTYPNAQIRKYALEYRYEHLKESWPELPAMLLDSGKGVREYAAYILERHTDLDIRGYYLEHLQDERPEYAILGLAECSRRGNVEALLPCLAHPAKKVRKSTLLALGRQEDFEDEALLWRYLLDEEADISKAAYISMRSRDFCPGAGRLYRAWCRAEKEHQKRYLLRLLLRENSWARLPWLIRIYSEELPEEEKRLVRGGIACRFMYTKVPEAQKEEICRALAENGGTLPAGMEKAIRYDMKFV